eukprot:9826928-Alexandrium_andersonii.AAC.1
MFQSEPWALGSKSSGALNESRKLCDNLLRLGLSGALIVPCRRAGTLVLRMQTHHKTPFGIQGWVGGKQNPGGALVGPTL